MTITHNWQVKKLVQKNDGSGLVIQVFYRVRSTDGEYSRTSIGDVKLETENISNFVPYQNLTEELIIQWIKDKLGPNSEDLEQMNTDWIITTKNPSTKVEKLPWIPEPAPEPVPEPTPEPTPDPEITP